MSSLTLYSYFRSSTSWRVRIALNLKGMDYEMVPVNLLKGEHRAEPFAAINPSMSLPAVIEDGRLMTQSLAILEYLEEITPNPPLLPTDAADRARVRSLAQMIACDIHPVNNLRILKYLTGELKHSEDEKTAWMHHWFKSGFNALEMRLRESPNTGTYCHGEQVGMADICLVPQVYNARRFGFELDAYPMITRIDAACATLPAFVAAHPEQQPDAA